MTAIQGAETTPADDKLRVLVVDDDRDQTEGLKDLLEPRGHQIAVAHNIEETRRRLHGFDAQVALIDLRLGQENGIDLVRELKTSHPRLKCMLLTAYADLDSTIEAVKEGVFDFLRKPLSPASLFVSLDHCTQQIHLELAKLQAEEALEKRIVALTQPLEKGDESIDFAELFNIDEIQHVQDLFAKATGVASMITRTDGTPITRPSNFCRLCNDIIRKNPKGLKNCLYSDSIVGRHNPDGPTIQPCFSCGLWDAGASITVGGKHLANWLVGQVKNEAQDEQLAIKYAREIDADEDDFRKAFREVPVMSEEQFNNVAQMLYAFANQLSSMAYQNVQQARFIAERKEYEEQLQRERDFSAQVINSLPGLFYVFDDKQFVKWNPRWEEISGYSSEELGKLYGSDFFEGTDKKTITERIQETFSKGAMEAEAEFVTKDGRKIPYFFTGTRCIFDGVPHFVGLGVDITERKQIEAEREQLIGKLESQNAELERFTYTVSHDLKSPLITVKGFVGMMHQDLAKGDSVAVNDDLARISNAADKMDQLLKDLLELSRIGRLVNPPEERPLLELAKEALEITHGQIVRRGVKVDISPDLPTVYGDRLRLLEVLQNLIDNAVKYMGDQPHPHVEIGFRRECSETIYYVRDNGIGINPNYQDKVFGLFEQLDQHVEGSGIGLALVKRIIEIHGGRIWVESEGSGHGSSFCFTIANRPESH